MRTHKGSYFDHEGKEYRMVMDSNNEDRFDVKLYQIIRFAGYRGSVSELVKKFVTDESDIDKVKEIAFK